MRRISGVMVGIVRDLSDPSGQGRIRLEFPQLEDAPISSLAPVAAPMAGPSRGAFLMPEVGDEVLVSFEQGDINHPYIVGYLWNGVDTPPESDPKNRVVLTPGGHTLRFQDGEGSKMVVLRSNSGHKVTLDDTAAGQSLTLETSSGNLSVKMDDLSQSITLSGGGRSITMAAGMVQIS